MKVYRHLGLLAIILAFATTYGMSQYPRGNQEPGNGNKIKAGQGPGKGCMYSNIPELSKEQKLKIDKILLEQKKEALEIKTELDAKNVKLKTLLTTDNPDKAVIDALIDEMGKIKADMQKKHAAHTIEIRKLLTEEQKVYFDSRLLGKGTGCGMGAGACMGTK